MTKRTYIQPISETMVLPKDVLMNEPVPASKGTWPEEGPADPAPKRRTPVY